MYPLPNQEAVAIAEVLVKEFVCRFGTPREIHSDQGRNFESKVFAEMCRILGIRKTGTTPFHPQSDGIIEIYNQMLEHQLAMFVNQNQRDWDQDVPLLLMAYRTPVQESTGCNPAKLIMGHELRMPIDLLYGHPEDCMQQHVTEYAQNL